MPETPRFSVTSVGEAPTEERSHRFRNYTIAMVIRMACIVALPFVHGWWLLLVALGAVFLPYFAVVIANAKSTVGGNTPEAVGPLALGADAPAERSPASEPADPESAPGAGVLLVVDAAGYVPAEAAGPAPHAEPAEAATPEEPAEPTKPAEPADRGEAPQ